MPRTGCGTVPVAGKRAAGDDGRVTDVRTVHTSGLSGRERDGIRDLLDRAFGDRFDGTDWEHALGGLHIVVTDHDAVIAHAAVVQRLLVHDERPLRTGYVEAVAVDRAHRGRGHAATVMAGAERVIRSAYQLGALSSSSRVRSLYLARGWLPWEGLTYVLAPTGLTRTPADDRSTLVFAVPGGPPLRTDGVLACDWRSGDPW